MAAATQATPPARRPQVARRNRCPVAATGLLGACCCWKWQPHILARCSVTVGRRQRPAYPRPARAVGSPHATAGDQTELQANQRSHGCTALGGPHTGLACQPSQPWRRAPVCSAAGGGALATLGEVSAAATAVRPPHLFGYTAAVKVMQGAARSAAATTVMHPCAHAPTAADTMSSAAGIVLKPRLCCSCAQPPCVCVSLPQQPLPSMR